RGHFALESESHLGGHIVLEETYPCLFLLGIIYYIIEKI
ncbi:MAG: hypothetical protein ACD_7C00369G0001, partial [uncultured bacterium]